MAATYTVKQVAEILGYSTNSIYTFLKQKRIEGVRVGRGRFRIPQAELDRLLMTSKKQGQQKATQPSSTEAPLPTKTPGVQDIPGDIETYDTPRAFGTIHLGVPNLFNWFVAMGAVIAGLGLFLFNQTFTLSHPVAISPSLVQGLGRIILIGGGLGVVLSNIMGKRALLWRRVFFVLLGITGLTLSFMLWKIGDIDAMLTYGSISFVIFVTLFSNIGGIAAFSLYMSLLAIDAVLIPIIAPGDVHVVAIANSLNLSVGVMTLIVSVGAVFFITLLWWGYARERIIFWLTTWIAALSYFGLAYWYGQNGYWSRAFFFVVVGITAMFAYLWEELVEHWSKRERMLIAGVLASIFIVLVLGVVVVRVLQTNVLTTVQREDVQKVMYAKNRMEQAIQEVENTMNGVSVSPDFINAFSTKDIATLNALSKIVYDSNKNIRRIVFLDANGQGLLLYPFGTFDQQDLSFRDYFVNPRDTGKLFVSNIFESEADQSHREIVVVAVPVYKDHEFIGVIGASLDLDAIGARLQQIGVPDRGEYISVVDTKGKRIIIVDPLKTGTDTFSEDPTLLGAKGEKGVTVARDPLNGSAVVAYDTIDDLGWGVSIWSPLDRTYQITNTATISIFLLILTCVVIATVIVQGAHVLWRRSSTQGGSP